MSNIPVDNYGVPQPFPSFVLNQYGGWEPPVKHPGDGIYNWDEATRSWIRKVEQ